MGLENMTEQISLVDRFRQHWRAQWKSHLGTLALLVVVIVVVQAWQTRNVPSGLAPDFQLVVVQADGTTSKSSLQAWRLAHPNQAIALHFWADWCPICRTEENSITRLSADWPVLTVAMQSGTPDNVQQVLRKRQLPWHVAVDEHGHTTSAYGFKGVPAFVVIDKDGHMRTPTMGYTTEIGMRLRLWWATLVTG